LAEIIEEEGYLTGQINFILTYDEKLLNLNKEFLSRNYFTDIITFDYSERGKLKGDIFISVDRVIENAEKYKVPDYEELLRVFVHGVLHMMGYRDKNTDEKKKMRTMENYYLGKIIPNV